jgi:branched-chain amino acid transport system substrate-binding protein
MVRRSWAVIAAAVLGVIMVVSGCSSGTSSSSSSGGSSASAGTSSALSGAPIRVGFICSCSGTDASTVGDTEPAMEAWASWVNATGGISGHPVKLFVENDSNVAAQGLQDVQALVEQDKVIAIVGMNSTTDPAWAGYVQGTGVPVVGGVSNEVPFTSNPDFFPTGPGVATQTYGVLSAVKAAGKTGVGMLYCAEAPVCAEAVPLAQADAKAVGLGFQSAKISATAPNYYAPCLQMKNDGVDAVYTADAPSVGIKAAADCADNG